MLKVKLLRGGQQTITEYLPVRNFSEKEIYKNLLFFIIKHEIATRYEVESIKFYKGSELSESIQNSWDEEYDYVAVLNYNGSYDTTMNGITISGNGSLFKNPPTVTSDGQVTFTCTFLSQIHIGMKKENPQGVDPEDFKKYLTHQNPVLRSLAKKIHKS